jgi:hypothetical protein
VKSEIPGGPPAGDFLFAQALSLMEWRAFGANCKSGF